MTNFSLSAKDKNLKFSLDALWLFKMKFLSCIFLVYALKRGMWVGGGESVIYCTTFYRYALLENGISNQS